MRGEGGKLDENRKTSFSIDIAFNFFLDEL